jgi:hypothetical protein
MYVTKVEAAELKLLSNTMNWWVRVAGERLGSLEVHTCVCRSREPGAALPT